jgi:hypothetical protein
MPAPVCQAEVMRHTLQRVAVTGRNLGLKLNRTEMLP